MECLICGEEKEKAEFKNVMYFSTYKKRKVQWCRDCQRMYAEMKQSQEFLERTKEQRPIYTVSFP